MTSLLLKVEWELLLSSKITNLSLSLEKNNTLFLNKKKKN